MGERRRKASAEAYVVAVNMGYGHERAANALRHLASKGEVIVANDYKGIPPKEKRLWDSGRGVYERVSRFKRVPILGALVFKVLDELQEIPPFYPRRDLSRPSLQVRQTMGLIENQGLCRHLVQQLAKKPLPLICTFFTPAFAAEFHGYPGDIYLVVCDADVSRAWVPMQPKKSRIKYFAPTGRVAERLRLYGVKQENILLTGFPLSPENVGGVEEVALREDLERRLCVLDPHGVFAEGAQELLAAKFGSPFCRRLNKKRKAPFSVTFAIGGAGAQRELVAEALRSLSTAIREGDVAVNVVAGTRPDVIAYFEREFRLAGLVGAVKSGGVTLLATQDRQEYFAKFDALMRETDVLWTKPSELSFYAGLGLPMLMAPTVGSQEDFNRQWLLQVGAGVDALEPRYMNEWLFDWLKNGALARMAWNGYVNAPTHGAYRIANEIRGQDGALRALPMVV